MFLHPPQAEEAVVVMVAGDAIYILDFVEPASGNKTPPGQQMVRSAAAEADAEAEAEQQQRRRSERMQTDLEQMRRRCYWWSHGQKLPDESKRPDPKQMMVEQGLHPHPGPTAWDHIRDEIRAETDDAAFEYCCRYTFSRWKAVEQVPGGPKLSSIWEDPYWKIVADANAPRVLTDTQARRAAQSRTAALERRAARMVI